MQGFGHIIRIVISWCDLLLANIQLECDLATETTICIINRARQARWRPSRVCVCERERERKRESVCERERKRVSVLV